MHSLLSLLGIETWKPVLTALVLPPVPLLLMLLLGARLILPRRSWGWLIVLASVGGLWLTACSGFARAIEPLLLSASPPLRPARIAELRAEAPSAADKRAGGSTVAIVVLGGGVEPYAPEYGTSNLSSYSLESLRYGLWLGRETGWPVAFSGGVGWGNQPGAAEADVAARIAAQDYGRPLRWVEADSRDTRENAARSVPMLQAAGVRHILLVTRGWHMQRAKFLFEEAARNSGLRIDAAPMGLATGVEIAALAWIPSSAGFERVRLVLREWLGWKLRA
ncbi:MAG: YdcF family protein [Pseudomonadota bacterium]|nr:YdcF family protein [Pseudomonadota bacterium]